MKSGGGLLAAVRPAPKTGPSLTVRSICGLGSVLWIPVQVEQHYGLNRI